MSWWHYQRKPRRQAVGGIKAKSQRGQIGATWWSGRFIKVLESFNIGARLARGRSYARSGQVMSLKVESGLVTAQVQGSMSSPYKVRIAIKILANREWRAVERAMAEQALFMAKLLAGEMPNEIEAAFTACNLKLFPASTRDLETHCSCPDWSNPCKHIAATYYILAEKFDEDPFLIFAWRGRTKAEISNNLRALRRAMPAPEVAEPEALLLAEEVAPLAECLNDFWRIAPDLAALRIHPQAAAVPDAVLRQMGATTIDISGQRLTDALLPAYKVMTVRAAARAVGGETTKGASSRR